jgi:chaperonin GroEL
LPSLQPKKIIFRDEARASMLKGVNTLADVVGATLGCAGRGILLDQGPFQPARSSRDGVTVARHIHLADPVADLAAQLLYQAAKKAADVAGDGTSTTVVLAQALFREGVRLVAAGANPTLLKRGIDAATKAIVGEKSDDGSGRYLGGTLSALTIPVTSPDQIAQVGTLSANSDPAIGNLIAAALAQVGKDGTVTVEESQSLETTLDVVEGMQFNQGYLSPYFITDPERMECQLTGDDANSSSNPLLIYLHEKPLRHLQEILPILNNLGLGAPFTGSLLVIAEDITDSALAFLAVNKYQGRLRACAVKGPGFGDRRRALFDDLAVLTGATLISPELGLKPENITREMLGRATKVTITKDDTTVVGGMGQPAAIDARRNDLREQIARSTSDFDRTRLEERLAKLTGGVAVVRVGGQTEAEMKERKDRAEDAMYATRAAVLEGIVPGGGVTLIRCGDALGVQQGNVSGDELAGWNLVRRACEEPLRRIVTNAGGEGGEIVAEFRRRLKDGHDLVTAANADGVERTFLIQGYGYNAATSEFTDLLTEGVIDPARVTRTALLAASSIAGLLLTNEAIVADDVEAAAEVRKSLTPVMPGGQGQMLQY